MIAEATIAALGFSRAAMSLEAQALPVAPVVPPPLCAVSDRSRLAHGQASAEIMRGGDASLPPALFFPTFD
ncbi:hypothetical protein [Methylocella sp.]|uniref:hypothetical protein n=1 Tax=Methylocella sp. TaxID=1978226 RepID=UPI003C272100